MTAMEGDGKFKLIIAGLILAAFAVGYFILSQKVKINPGKPNSSGDPVVSKLATPSPKASSTPENVISNGGKLPNTGISSLPSTGFPLPLALPLVTSVMLSGWYLRKYSR